MFIAGFSLNFIFKLFAMILVVVMTWSLFLLAKHHDVQRKLFKEIHDVLGGDEPGYFLKVTPENIDQLVYVYE